MSLCTCKEPEVYVEGNVTQYYACKKCNKAVHVTTLNVKGLVKFLKQTIETIELEAIIGFEKFDVEKFQNIVSIIKIFKENTKDIVTYEDVFENYIISKQNKRK